jgi:ribosomal protein S18 acetylase RimI-like enzyme
MHPIRCATPAAARAIAEVQVASWRVAYRDLMSETYLAALSTDRREAAWRDSIARASPEILVAGEPDAVLGWIAFDRSRDPGAPAGTGEIWSLYADPAHWSRGVGRALWAGAHPRLRARGFEAVTLWVLTGNPRARRFYSRLGLAPEPAQVKTFEMGGRTLEEIRYQGAIGSARPLPADEPGAPQRFQPPPRVL